MAAKRASMKLFNALKKTKGKESDSQNFLNEYKILNIRGLFENLYGETVIVEANPLIKAAWGGISVVEHEYKYTRHFIIPKSMVDALVKIAQSGKYWNPNMEDFKLDKVFNEDSNKRMSVFRHKYFYEF